MLAVVFKCLTCSTLDDVTDDVILRNVGGLVADVINPIKFNGQMQRGERWMEGGLEGGREPERSRVTG